ncbi:MAG: hypothetical protein QM760_07425 [Nibricoccus sp.]
MTLSHLVEANSRTADMPSPSSVHARVTPITSASTVSSANTSSLRSRSRAITSSASAFLRAENSSASGAQSAPTSSTSRPRVLVGYSALLAARKLVLPVTSSFHTNFHSYSRHYGFALLTRPALAYLRHFHNRTRITLSRTVELNDELTRDGFRDMRLMSRGEHPRLHPLRFAAKLSAPSSAPRLPTFLLSTSAASPRRKTIRFSSVLRRSSAPSAPTPDSSW